MSSTYCDFASGNDIHGYYHDHEYGFPVSDEAILLERFALEIFQAGLSWEIILKKRATTLEAFEGFDVDTVASYGEADVERLLGNAGIIRNRLKVNSIIDNAGRIRDMRSQGGLTAWLAHHHPLNRKEWTKLFKKTFRFTGGEIVNEFLMSIGYLPGAHVETCAVYSQIAELNPAWSQVEAGVFTTD